VSRLRSLRLSVGNPETVSRARIGPSFRFFCVEITRGVEITGYFKITRKRVREFEKFEASH